MAQRKPFSNEQVKAVFDGYPDPAKKRMLELRDLILLTIDEEDLHPAEETLKWGEPSYLVKGGSTLRIDWKEKNPEYYSLFVNCQTTLIETFREIYPDAFTYDGKRALHIKAKGRYPRKILRHCILLTLTYHKRKHLDLLGV